MLIGTIKEVVCHPVKSCRGESVEKSLVMDYGLYGDRSHAFLDETRPGKFLTITQFPQLVQYHASFVGEERIDTYPKVEMKTPNGITFDWDDERLLKEIEEQAARKISRIKYIPTHVPLGAIEEEHIQLVSDASLEKMKEMWGEDVDHRRFRPNLIISLTEKIPFAEESWFGNELRIGEEVKIEIKRHTKRCMIINVHPDHAGLDHSLLKTIVKERDNHFGVYASVVKTGEIKVGDQIFLSKK